MQPEFFKWCFTFILYFLELSGCQKNHFFVQNLVRKSVPPVMFHRLGSETSGSSLTFLSNFIPNYRKKKTTRLNENYLPIPCFILLTLQRQWIDFWPIICHLKVNSFSGCAQSLKYLLCVSNQTICLSVH